jgi:hypothetical protein
MGAPGTISLARSDISAVGPPPCYKFELSKIVEQWLLFEYVGLEFTPLSKPFKRRNRRRKRVKKYPERLRKDSDKEVAGAVSWREPV